MFHWPQPPEGEQGEANRSPRHRGSHRPARVDNVNHFITPTAEGATRAINMLMIGLGGDANKIGQQ